MGNYEYPYIITDIHETNFEYIHDDWITIRFSHHTSGQGFEFEFDLICLDIDECEEGSDNCDGHATCTNTPGHFECDCNNGFEGDGTDCKGKR